MTETKINASDLLDVLKTKKKKAIKEAGTTAGYSEMITKVLLFLREEESKWYEPKFNIRERFDLGYWYDLFDDLSLYVSEADFK